MSKADERRRAQQALLEDAGVERPNEPPRVFSSDPTAWESQCFGWKVAVHEQSKDNRVAGIWRCRWCGRTLQPPQKESSMTSPFDGVAEPPELVTEPAEPTNVIPFPEPPEPPELLDVATTPVHFPVILVAREGEEVRPVRIADLLSPAQRVAELVEALQGALVAPEQEAELERLVSKANCLEVTDAASMQICSELYEMLHANEKGIEDGDIGKVVAFFHRPWKAMTIFRGRFLDQVKAAKGHLSDVGGAWRLQEKRRAEEQRRHDEQAEAEKDRERLRQLAATATKAGDLQTAAVVEEMVKEVTPTALPLQSAVPATPTKGRDCYVVDAIAEDAFYEALFKDPTRRRAAPPDMGYLNRQAKDLGTDMPKRFPGVTVKEKGGLSAGGRR